METADVSLNFHSVSHCIAFCKDSDKIYFMNLKPLVQFKLKLSCSAIVSSIDRYCMYYL